MINGCFNQSRAVSDLSLQAACLISLCTSDAYPWSVNILGRLPAVHVTVPVSWVGCVMLYSGINSSHSLPTFPNPGNSVAQSSRNYAWSAASSLAAPLPLRHASVGLI